MIRLIPRRRIRIPNALAVCAAVILAVTSYAGLQGQSSADQEVASQVVSEAELQAEKRTGNVEIASNKRKLNISRLLFGHG